MPTANSIKTTTNSAALVANSTGVPVWTSAMTDGQVILGSTGATPVAASLTAGTNITLTPGAGSLTIAASGAAGGGWFLIQTQTASNSATLDFTTGINSTYKNYVFVIDYLVPATDEVQLFVVHSSNAGSTWLGGDSTYNFVNWISGSEGTDDSRSSNAANQLELTGASTLDMDNEATGGWSGCYWFYDPSNTVNSKTSTWDGVWRLGGSTESVARTMGAGQLDDVTYALNGVRFIMSSGSISTGSIALYGIKNA